MVHFHIILNKIRKALCSIWFMLAVFAGAAGVVIAQAPVAGTIGFILLICALLLLSDNTAVTLLPFSLLCMFLTKEYKNLDLFLDHLWLIVPLVGSVLFHLIHYREKPQKSILLYALGGIALAITLGGLGSISLAEFLTGENLYYVSGLGIGMVLMHLLVSAKYHDRDGFDIGEYVCLVMYITGLFAVFMLFQHLAISWESILEIQQIPPIKWSNNHSTFLMITLPFGFYFTKKHPLHIFSVLLMFAAMVLTGSRSPLVFGVLELIVCLVVFCIIDKKQWYVYAGVLAALVLVAVWQWEPLIALVLDKLNLENMDMVMEEARFKMALCAFDEFRANPLFGSGLGAASRQDIFAPAVFEMHWYHSAPFQIIGSLGTLGIAAYGFLWYTRAKVFFQDRSLFAHTAMLSQFGLFLISLVNPGFFCPFPFEFYMVMLFAIMAQQKPAKN